MTVSKLVGLQRAFSRLHRHDVVVIQRHIRATRQQRRTHKSRAAAQIEHALAGSHVDGVGQQAFGHQRVRQAGLRGDRKLAIAHSNL